MMPLTNCLKLPLRRPEGLVTPASTRPQMVTLDCAQAAALAVASRLRRRCFFIDLLQGVGSSPE